MVRLTEAERAMLTKLAKREGHTTTSECVRWLIRKAYEEGKAKR